VKLVQLCSTMERCTHEPMFIGQLRTKQAGTVNLTRADFAADEVTETCLFTRVDQSSAHKLLLSSSTRTVRAINLAVGYFLNSTSLLVIKLDWWNFVTFPKLET